MAGGITTLVDGRLYSLGGIVDVDGQISWFTPEARGFAPVNSYLLLEDEAALLIDSGVPVHEETLLEQVRSLLPAGVPLSILHTRIVEFDTVGNTAALLREFPIGAVYSNFPTDLWVHFHPKWDVPGVEPADLWPADKRKDCRIPYPGETVEFAAPGNRVLDVVAAPLRLLATFWIYDRETRTLFTSDSFGHALMGERGESRVVEPAGDEIALEEVSAHLLGKFDWLAVAETGALREQLARIFDTFEVETIAPGYGRILHGRDVVDRHYGMIDRALEEAPVRRAGATR